MVVSLVSCTADEADLSLGTAVDSDTPQITLYITFSGGTTRTTDATWGDTYTSAEATAFETTISSLQVLFFNTDGSLAGASEQKSLWSYTNSSDDNTDEVGYEYIGSIDVSNASFASGSTTTNADGTSTTTFTGTIMLLANCPDATTTDYTKASDGTVTYGSSSSSTDDSSDDSTDDDTTTNPPILIRSLANATDANGNTLSTDIERMAYLTYNYADVTTSTGLPMWGIATTANISSTGSLTFTSGYNTSLGTIDLLRAMSRILVNFDDDTYADGFQLNALAINKYHTTGYCLPNGYITTSSVTGTDDTVSTNPATVSATTALSQDDCRNIPASVESITGTSTVTTSYTYTTTESTETTYSTVVSIATNGTKTTTSSTTPPDSGTLTAQSTKVETTYVSSSSSNSDDSSDDGSTSSESTSSASGPLLVSADNGGYFLYLPEYVNDFTDDDDDDDVHLFLTLGISRTVSGDDSTLNPYTGYMTLTLQDYTSSSTSSTGNNTGNTSAASTASGDHYGLIRNHSYSFTLTQIDNSTLSVVSTDNWDTSESTVGWDVDNATVSFLAAKGTYSDCDKGDTEAVYCLLNYPRWGSDHTKLSITSAYASYELEVSSDYGQITWAAYLDKNESFFKFSTGQTSSDDLGLGHTNYKGSKNGVSRSDPYLIKLSCAYKWSELKEMAHPTKTDDDGNIPDPSLTPDSDGTIWTYTTAEGFNEDDEENEGNNVDVIYYGIDSVGSTTYQKLVAIYTDLFLLAKGSDGVTKALPINPKEGSTVGTTTVGTSLFTPNWFPGGGEKTISVTVDGETYTLGDNQWVRIYQARASLTSTADGGNTYGSICEWISKNSPKGERYWKGSD